jgi:hypothetical protein
MLTSRAHNKDRGTGQALCYVVKRTVSPVRVHSLVRSEPALCNCNARVVIQPGQIVPDQRSWSPLCCGAVSAYRTGYGGRSPHLLAGEGGVLSRPDHRDLFILYVWLVRVRIGWETLCSLFLCFGRVWFSIRDSCLSLYMIGNHT